MKLVTVLVFTIGLATVYGSNCVDVSGNWQNELGSRMVLNVEDTNRISGKYYTAVETNPGAAAFVSNIAGLFSKQSDGSLVAFSVIFNHGTSLASWVGQCMVCDGKEVLYTTYTLRKYVANHREKWAAITTNQNTFWKTEEDNAENVIDDSSIISFPSERPLSVISLRSPGGLEMRGKWKSNDAEEIEFFEMNGDVLEGRTTCCHQIGKMPGKHHSTDLIGKKDGNEMFTAVTWMSTSSKRMRSWTGHIYDTVSPDSKTLEASWLEHEFNPSCASPRNMVRFGTQNFTRKTTEFENIVSQPETFLDKLKKFFSTMF